ncbi:MAG: alpha/beta fold hydrolase [Nocardioidaceae bacterium]
MVSSPLWFGADERRLFGWVHTPPAPEGVRASLVICPSMGLEAGFSHFVLRNVADELAARGFLVVRFDYDGTGDSAGSGGDPDRVSAWRESVRNAVQLARSIADVPVALLGMRIGAILATYEAEAMGGADALVLWDPPRSGRSFIREQRTRQSVTFGEADGAVPTFTAVGMNFSEETVAELSTLDLRRFHRLPAAKCLVVERTGRRVFARDLEGRGDAAATVIEADDQDDLLLRQMEPRKTMRSVVGWLEGAFAQQQLVKANLSVLEIDGTRALTVPAAPEAGVNVHERLVDLGPRHLFGVLSEPAGTPTGPVIVFVPDAHTPHVGLSRMWVDLARSWSSKGARVLRFDLSGSGDSDVRPGVEPHRVALVEHIEDVNDVARAISPQDPSDVVFIGICSGAYLTLESALELGPRGICVLNPVFSFITAERPVDRRRRAMQRTRTTLNALFGRAIGRAAHRISPVLRFEGGFDWSRWFEAGYWQRSIVRRGWNLPEPVWRLLNGLMLSRRPADVLQEIVRNGTDVYIIAGDPDHEHVVVGGRKRLARMERGSRLRIDYLPGLDHSVLKAGMRERVMALLTEHVESRLLQDPVDPA